MAFQFAGFVDFTGGMDPEGHRTYKVRYKVWTQSNQDGPAAAMQTPGLPAIGSTYAYGTGLEYDLWAWRQPGMEVEKVPGNAEGDFPYVWYVTLTFSTKPRRRDQERPQDSDVQDPLAEPQKASGSWVKEKEVATEDRHGNPVIYSSFEPIVGPLNEWDADKDQVVIEQNVAALDYPTFAAMKNCLNDRPLWGFPARAIKLSGASWRKNWGKHNSVYFTRTFTFQIRVKIDVQKRTVGSLQTFSGSHNIIVPEGSFSAADIGRSITGPGIPVGSVITDVQDTSPGNFMTVIISTLATASGTISGVVETSGGTIGDWDRDILDESGRCISGYWSNSLPRSWIPDVGVDADNPADYIQCVDPAGNPTRLILNGNGVPWDASMGDTSTQGKIHVEKYNESNFLLLNIPISI